MNDFLIYLLNSAICLSLLYLLFRVLQRKEPFFELNRIILLSIVLSSLAIPRMILPHFIHKPIEAQILHTYTVQYDQLPEYQYNDNTELVQNNYAPEETDNTHRQVSFSIREVFLYSYAAGFFTSILILFYGLLSVILLYRRAEIKLMEGYRVLIVKKEIPAFSFGRLVFISQNDYQKHSDVILAHEKEHIRLNHFYDLIFLETVKIIYWFNPFIYWLIRDMKDIHEFQADNHTLTKGIDATQYQLLIIKKGVGPQKFALANSFNHCQIKNRIVMMNKLKTSKAWRWKVAIFLPMLVLLLMAFGKKGENVPPEKETLTSVVPLPQDPVKQWTEADFKELTGQNTKEFFEKQREIHTPPPQLINIHIDQKSKITKNTKIGDWEPLNFDEIKSLIEKTWAYNEKMKKIIPFPLVLISKDSTTIQADFRKLLNAAANSILEVRDNFSKKLYGLSYPKLTAIQHNEIDKLIPMNVVYCIGKPEMVKAPVPGLNQKGQTSQANILKEIPPPPPPPPPIFIDIKKEGIYLMKKLATIDEFRKQLPEVVKKNPKSEVRINIYDKDDPNIQAVDNILKEAGISAVKYRNTIKFTPPFTSDIKIPERNTFSMQVDAKGKVFVGFDGQDNRRKLLTRMGENYNIVFSPKELEEFSKIDSYEVPMNRMKAFLKMSAEERQKLENAIGIPYDSGNNEFKNWIRTARTVNKDMRIILKGDQSTSYQVIDQLIETLRDLHENRLYLALAGEVTAIEIAYPSKTGGPGKFTQSAVLDYARSASNVITIIPDKDNSIYYYLGTQDAKGNNPVLTKTDFSPSGIHELLIKKNYDALAKMENLKKKKQDLKLSEEDFEKQRDAILSDKTATIVMIKPTDASNFGNFMDILYEMVVCGIGRYAVIDLSDYDKNLISKAR